jgi:hypothetical protein
MPVILLGGIYSGIVTPTEAAAVAAAYAFLVAVLWYRNISMRDTYLAVLNSSRSTASIGMLIAGALAFNYVVTVENIPNALARFMNDYDLAAGGFLLLVNIVLLVLGCLLEKERVTPENYPLSLNSLIAACNQSTNRDPVVSYDEKAVESGVDSLREKKLATMTLGAGSRVPKYRHNLLNHFELNQREIALLCVLLLRGPQTPGELRSGPRGSLQRPGAGHACRPDRVRRGARASGDCLVRPLGADPRGARVARTRRWRSRPSSRRSPTLPKLLNSKRCLSQYRC